MEITEANAQKTMIKGYLYDPNDAAEKRTFSGSLDYREHAKHQLQLNVDQSRKAIQRELNTGPRKYFTLVAGEYKMQLKLTDNVFSGYRGNSPITFRRTGGGGGTNPR